jgi:hypothetical protein
MIVRDKRSSLFVLSISDEEEKVFLRLTPVVSVIKSLFSLSMTKRPNKLECLPLATLSILV